MWKNEAFIVKAMCFGTIKGGEKKRIYLNDIWSPKKETLTGATTTIIELVLGETLQTNLHKYEFPNISNFQPLIEVTIYE